MAQFSAKKIDTTKINGGQQVVNGSGVTPELFNAPVESALYTEKAIEVLTSNADVSQANAVGTPTVSFVSKTEGGVEYKYLKFANLKGETGKTGRTGPEGPEGKIGPVGPRGQTGAAAGFGTPTISVETLGEGSDATATVRASGDNTAKVFAFNLGIPKGDTGRGIKTVVSDGNDLIIKYDDKTEERLRGAIQTINALVADSKADFDAALIEENIGKTISYKDNLYLIIGRGRTKLVNNGITDYNALSNTPVYIATSEESFNQYLQSYNVNKIVSYNGDLYTVVETKNAPIEVGDKLSSIYFDTSKTPDFDALSYEIDGTSDGMRTRSATILDLASYPSALIFTYNSSDSGYMQLIASGSIMFYVNGTGNVGGIEVTPESLGIASFGWQTDIFDMSDTSQSEFSDTTVTSVNQQDLWSSYISKEPFGAIIDKKVSGVPSGGTAGQVLTKTTDNDYDAEWSDVSGGVTDVQVNGTSVVTDGVANITGTVTDGAQTFNGAKTFIDTLILGENASYHQQTAVVSYASESMLQEIFTGIGKTLGFYPKKTQQYTELFKINLYKSTGEWQTSIGFGINGNKPSIFIDGSPIGIPKTTSADAGKFLKVGTDGGWVAESIPNAEEASF